MRRQIIAAFTSLVAIASAQVDPTIPLRIRPPAIADPFDGAIRAQQIILQRQQTELLRQQTEALRQENDARARAIAEAGAQQNRVSAPLSRATPNDTQTYGFANGRAWQGSSLNLKLGYLIGVCEALAMAEALKGKFPMNLSLNEVRLWVDRFYEEPENLLIPVIEAVRIGSMKEAGAQQPEVDYATSLQRRVSNDAPERKIQ